MEKLDYLLKYLSELGSLLRTVSNNGEDIRALGMRINRVSDMIEEAIARISV